MRFSFHGKDTSTISWSSTGYLHGDSVPYPARLAPSILKNSFWSTQGISFRIREFYDTKVNVNARVMSPLHSDSSSGRLAFDVSGGMPFLRAKAKITCKEASENCRQTTYQADLSSEHPLDGYSATFFGGAKTTRDRPENSW